MPKNDGVEFYHRFLTERFSNFRTSLTAFIRTLALEDGEKKVLAARAVLMRINDLKLAMSTSDHPRWIDPLANKLDWYCRAQKSQQDAGLEVFTTILSVNPAIESQQWNFADPSISTAIDFAQIYAEYYRASRIPELFDELVAQLENIIDSGAIDSIKTIKMLEKLIATIRKNARGDYFSTRGAWEFTQVYLKNLLMEILESIPVIKQTVRALRKTLADLDTEMAAVHEKTNKTLTQHVSGDLPMLEYKPRALLPPESKPEGRD